MLKLLAKIILTLFFWGIFIYVVLQVPYPNSLTEATILQLLGFFIPLFLALTFTINISLKNVLSSGSISLGIIFLLILKSLNSLNIVSAILIILAVGLLVSYFRKVGKKKRLTNYSKIPKLTNMRKHNSSS